MGTNSMTIRKGRRIIARSTVTVPDDAGPSEQREAFKVLGADIDRQKNEYAKLTKRPGQGFRRKRKPDDA